MEFLHGKKLTERMRNLARSNGPIKIAIAYWGVGGIKLLGLNPKNPNLEVVCCLKGGKSDPQEISQFGNRAKQNDQLHAKVIWTPKCAIVGSANASSNGLPEEEFATRGLIEAGTLIDDSTRLAEIENWLRNLFEGNSRKITALDLKAAKRDRMERLAGSANGSRLPELVDLPLTQLKRADLGIFIYEYDLSRKEIRKITAKLKSQNVNLGSDIDWYYEVSNRTPKDYPRKDYVTITYGPSRARLPRYLGFQRFLSDRPIKLRGEPGYIVLTQEGAKGVNGLGPFRFGAKSKRKIHAQMQKLGTIVLRHNWRDNTNAFVTWEPLYEFLSR